MIINYDDRTRYIYILVLVVKEKNNTYCTLSYFNLKSLLTNISTCIQNISEYFHIKMDIILSVSVVESAEKSRWFINMKILFMYILVDFFFIYFSQNFKYGHYVFWSNLHCSLPWDYSHLLPYFFLCQYIHRIIHLEHEHSVSQRPCSWW